MKENKDITQIEELIRIMFNNPSQIIGSIKDVTDCKQMQELLRKCRDIYYTIFEYTGTSIILIEENMIITKANSSFSRNTGYSTDEIIGRMKWTDIVHPGDRERMVKHHNLRRENQHSALPAYRFRYITKTGNIRYAFVNVQLIPGTRKSIASLLDITERVQTENSLMRSEEKFRTLVEYCPTAIMMHQGDCWIYANRTAVTLSGYTEEELYSTNYWNIVHPDYQNLIKQTGFKCIQEKLVKDEYEFKIITKTGIIKWCRFTGECIQYEDKPTILVSVEDITDKKNAALEKVKLEKQLHQAQKMEAVGILAGGIAHDFNNMLGVIIGYTEIALMNIERPHSLHGTLAEIRKAAENSADLTRQLLGFARKQTISPKVLDLNDILGGMLNMLRRIIGENIRLNWQLSSELWPVSMDPSQIDQILVNLCINSRDAILNVGIITIETMNITVDDKYCSSHIGFVPGDYVKMSVSDDGCGMTNETLCHIFEPFYTTKSVNKGTGLGLATVYGIVKQNKGFIYAYSEPELGTTIVIYLPRYLVKDKETAEHLREDCPENVDLSGHETILLVEDEPSILEVTTMMLEMQGYTVLAVRTPCEAINMTKNYSGNIHLLLTDVVMPEMNGLDLAKKILSFNRNIKIMFMSGYAANIFAHQGILDGGIHFVQKPFSMIQLSVKVREVLDRE